MASKKTQTLSLLEASTKDAERRITKVSATLAGLAGELEELPALSDEARSTSIGKLRDGEDDNIVALCNVVDLFPHYFHSIADKDHGTDDSKIETGPTRDAVARRKLLKGVADQLNALTSRVNDALLVLGAQIRSVSIPAYRIAQTNAANDPKLSSKMVPVAAFYGDVAKKAQATRKKNKKEKQG